MLEENGLHPSHGQRFDFPASATHFQTLKAPWIRRGRVLQWTGPKKYGRFFERLENGYRRKIARDSAGDGHTGRAFIALQRRLEMLSTFIEKQLGRGVHRSTRIRREQR